MDPSQQASIVQQRLQLLYPQPQPPLNFNNPHQLLFAVMLSVQSTDVLVNKITPALFARYPSVEDYAKCDVDELKMLIKPSGFYNTKAKNIKAAAEIIIKNFGGQVPRTMSELMTLPGVARKVANVVLAQAFAINEGIAVDTHIIRVAGRLGLTQNINPVKIEQDLIQIFAQPTWGDISLQLIFHGRQTCKARKPQCAECVLNDVCPSAFKIK